MDHNLLVSELQALIVETRRRYTDVKDAAEHALELLKSGPVPRETLLEHVDELLSPITLGCKTKVAKVVGISIAALQRLVSLGGVPTTHLPAILQTLASVANQAVDIQLKILQTLLSILTYNKDIHDVVLGNALLLCFKLQESRVSVVSSTAAATLRQAVMLIFDRLADPLLCSPADLPLTLPSDPPQELTLSAPAIDAFSILSDLCLLTLGSSGGGLWGGEEKEKPRILRLTTLQRTFGLELIESILSGYEEKIKQRPELLFLLRQSLTPLLLKLQGEKPTFPVALRICRLIFLLVRYFAVELHDEVETFLMLLLRAGTGDAETEEGVKKEAVPSYMRVLALEILRGICGDPALLHSLYEQYDQANPSGSKVFSRLVSSLSRLINERPALLGVNAEIHGIGIPSETSNASGYFDMGLGMVTAAASAGVNTVSSMMGSTGGGLGPQSALRQRLIEQHDKAEAPIVPETYPSLLALQSLNTIAEGMYHTVTTSSPPSQTTIAMADSAWPALLAALSLCISTSLSDQLFADLLSAFQNFTVACGLINLTAPRDAFISTLGKFAVPPPVVTAMQNYNDSSNSRSTSAVGAEALGLTSLGVGATPTPPALSERNLACLKSVVTIARILSSSLGEVWHDVLEVLQNANFIFVKRPGSSRRPTTLSPLSPGPSIPKVRTSFDGGERPDTFSDLDTDSLQSSISILFDGSKELDDAAFSTFVSALCQLSSEMIGVNSNAMSTSGEPFDPPSSPGLTPKSPVFPSSPGKDNRRRASGLQMSNSIKSGERSFSLTKLRTVAAINISRLVSKDPSVGWDAITQHLLAVARHPTAPSNIRTQATEALSELLLAAIRVGKEARTQHQVFNVLIYQVDIQPVSNILSMDYEVRSAGFHLLNQILESAGHSLEVGWQTIFNMLNSVCKDSSPPPATDGATLASRPSAFAKGGANLIRIAFPSLNIICTDFLSSLGPADMRQCIASLGYYGRQKEDVNIALASIGLLWNVSDAVQGNSKELWVNLLSELLELSRDIRLEVRSSAMQTLFRCIDLYGSTLNPIEWASVLDTVIFPLLDGMQADESQVLALTSVGAMFSTFITQLAALPSFFASYRRLLDTIQTSATASPRSCCTASLKAFERVLSTSNQLGTSEIQGDIDAATWLTFTNIGASVQEGEPYTQDNLLALVRVASLVHQRMGSSPEKAQRFSEILRSIMTYPRSPEYRPDIDSMSPLQQAIVDLISGSGTLPSNIVLSDLAEFASIAYAAEGSTSGRMTYVAVSKSCMPKMRDILARHASDVEAYRSGSIEAVLGAYALPIKLKYDCPPASKFGDDPPLWQTALNCYLPVLNIILDVLDRIAVDSDRIEAIWGLVVDIFAATLLADTPQNHPGDPDEDESLVLAHLSSMRETIWMRLGTPSVPDRVRAAIAETLRKASLLYTYDVRSPDGTTAPVIAADQERIRYWALGLLVSSSSQQLGTVKGKEREADLIIAKACLAALIKRFEDALRHFIVDGALRGQMPFPRVREEEVMYILRQLTTMRTRQDSIQVPPDAPPLLNTAYSTSTRAHIFRFYPLLLQLSFSRGPNPTMWVFPDEYRQMFSSSTMGKKGDDEVTSGGSDGSPAPNGQVDENEPRAPALDDHLNAGDGTDLIEVSARDLAQRCLQLVGEEMGLT